MLGYTWIPTMLVGKGCYTHLVAEDLPKETLSVAISKHLTCVKDDVIYNTYNCSRNDTRNVYGYSVKNN